MTQLSRFFFNGNYAEGAKISLDSDAAKHIWQVLRMRDGERILLANGNGCLAIGLIDTIERNICIVSMEKIINMERTKHQLTIGVALTKNNNRNEWMLEKITELGVNKIIPIQTSRTEKVHFRADRWEKIILSAMLQSQQNYVPELSSVVKLKDVLKKHDQVPQKLIAHCIDDTDKISLSKLLKPAMNTIILIGPEGDFSPEEVILCKENNYKAFSLGKQRLRTETAAITACAYYNVVNDEN